ncbi:MAG: glycoside hydrolase family 97 protein [Planctomycetaceae bacterium]|nr:glycoside hydrolase family 97 protein [Planctomycetaceae bacterium]
METDKAKSNGMASMTLLSRVFFAFAIFFWGTDCLIAEEWAVASPNGFLNLKFALDENEGPALTVLFHGEKVCTGSSGLQFLKTGVLRNSLSVIHQELRTKDSNFQIPVGKCSAARAAFREWRVSLREQNPPSRMLSITFRVFNDGIAFRYEIPDQPAIAEFTLTEEWTRLKFPRQAFARYLPLKNYTTSYEAYYQKRTLAEIPADSLIGLPCLLECPLSDQNSVWCAVTEANLTDYAGMYLSPDPNSPGELVSRLAPLPGRDDGAKVVGSAPHTSPWRVLMIADDPARLIESNIVFHLSEPSQIDDPSWIKPGKTTFPWWNGYVLENVQFEPGLNTATHKHYIDFCARSGIPYHSLDGTDTAWYGGPIIPRGPTDITTAVPEIDLPELLEHAKEKGVRLRLWMHWRALQSQLDEALPLFERWGIEGIMVDFMDRDDQEMVRFYHEVAEKAARHHLTVTWHGAFKPTGMERTWPNVLSYEGALNQEYNKWSAKGTPPEHNLDVAFVRMLAGPVDYHQGGMRNVLPQDLQPRNRAPEVPGTRGHQLAMYIVYQNHLPMMADFHSAYEGEPGFQFLVDVPVSWDETRVIHAKIDQCLVVARRNQDDWYLGGMAGGQDTELDLPFSFLPDGEFEVSFLLDDPAHGAKSLTSEKRIVSSKDSLKVKIPAAGGFVAKVKRASN